PQPGGPAGLAARDTRAAAGALERATGTRAVQPDERRETAGRRAGSAGSARCSPGREDQRGIRAAEAKGIGQRIAGPGWPRRIPDDVEADVLADGAEAGD